MTGPFDHSRYLLRRKVLRLLGGAFHVYGPDGEVVLYSEQKALRLREDIRLYSDETRAVELLAIRARQVLDFAAAYDVVDAQRGEAVGALRRRGLKSLVRDEWVILDAGGGLLGTIREESLGLALLRRFVTAVLPQAFCAEIGGQVVARYRQRFNPFVQKIDIDFTPDVGQRLDRRLGLAAAVLLCAIEGRQR